MTCGSRSLTSTRSWSTRTWTRTRTCLVVVVDSDCDFADGRDDGLVREGADDWGSGFCDGDGCDVDVFLGRGPVARSKSVALVLGNRRDRSPRLQWLMRDQEMGVEAVVGCQILVAVDCLLLELVESEVVDLQEQ